MNVIGIAGKAGSGKNTVAGILAAELVAQGYTVAVDAFAVGVKHEAKASAGWNGVKDECGRRLLQEIGSAWRAYCGKDWWTQELFARHFLLVGHLWEEWRFGSPHRGASDFLIVTDIRYANEIHWCIGHSLDKRAEWSGVVWFITGRGGLDGPAGQHASETELDFVSRALFRTTIVNEGSVEDLIASIHCAVELGFHMPAETRR